MAYKIFLNLRNYPVKKEYLETELLHDKLKVIGTLSIFPIWLSSKQVSFYVSIINL